MQEIDDALDEMRKERVQRKRRRRTNDVAVDRRALEGRSEKTSYHIGNLGPT